MLTCKNNVSAIKYNYTYLQLILQFIYKIIFKTHIQISMNEYSLCHEGNPLFKAKNNHDHISKVK